MNFLVKPYDPFDEALERFRKFNATPPHLRDVTEKDLIRSSVHRVKQFAQQAQQVQDGT